LRLGWENNPQGFRVLLAVESELGGKNGGSPKALSENVMEDFAKLLVINCPYKILIFTSLAFSKEESHVVNRVKSIEKVYVQSGIAGNILLIHLKAEPKISENGNQTNPQISLKEKDIRAFLLISGCEFFEIEFE
jgi:hypothetical protein